MKIINIACQNQRDVHTSQVLQKVYVQVLKAEL